MCAHHLADQGYRFVVLNVPEETYCLVEEFLKGYKFSRQTFYKHFLLDFMLRINPEMPINATYTGHDGRKLRMWIEPFVYEMVEKKAAGVSVRAYCYTALIHFLTKWQLEKAREKDSRRKVG